MYVARGDTRPMVYDRAPSCPKRLHRRRFLLPCTYHLPAFAVIFGCEVRVPRAGVAISWVQGLSNVGFCFVFVAEWVAASVAGARIWAVRRRRVAQPVVG